MHGFPNLGEYGSLFRALFFACTKNMYQLFPIFEENQVAITLDHDRNRDYVQVTIVVEKGRGGWEWM